jgi:hypothetical protein
LKAAISSLNEGHTNIIFAPWKVTDIDKLKNIIPLNVKFYNTCIIIDKIEDQESENHYKGFKILSINGISSEDIYSILMNYSFGDTVAAKESYFSFIFKYLTPFQLIFNYKYDFNEKYLLEIKSPKDEISKIKIKGISYKKLESYFQSKIKNKSANAISYSLSFPDKDIALIKFNECVNLDDKFKSFIGKSLEEVNKKNIKNIIVDIQNNSGGNSSSSQYLLEAIYPGKFVMANVAKVKISEEQIEAWLSSGRYKIWSKTKEDFIHGAKKDIGKLISTGQEKASRKYFEKSLFKGSIYVLIGSNVTSSATMLASAVKDYKMGYLIGYNTGDFPAHYGNYLQFYTPNTQLMFRVSSQFFDRPNGIDTGKSLPPDYYSDKPLETAIQIIRNKQKQGL